MVPSRTHATTTFLDFAPGTLSGCEPAARTSTSDASSISFTQHVGWEVAPRGARHEMEIATDPPRASDTTGAAPMPPIMTELAGHAA